jgi:hypothetical protein
MPDLRPLSMHTAFALIISLVLSAVAFAGAPELPAPMVLVAAEEIAELEAVLMAEVEKNRVRKCLRPVFSGVPTTGPADAKISEVIEGEVHQACYLAMKENHDAVAAYLDGPVSPENKAPEAIVAACISLPVAIAAAVQHADACSPYLFGRRGSPEMLPAVRGGRALAVLIRHEGTAGNWKGAIDMTLNGVRFYQDFNRGPGASLMVAMVSTAAIIIIIKDGIRPLLEVAIPPAAENNLALRGVSALLATDPTFCDCMPYERWGIPLQLMLPVIKGGGWEPPGGFDFGSTPPPEYPLPGTKRLGLAAGQEMALAWVAMETVHSRFAEMCRTNHTPANLFKAMRTASEEILAKPRNSNWKRVLLLLFAKDPQRALRDWITDILQSVAIPAFDKYVIRYAQRRFILQGLRLQLMVARYSKANGTCPSLKGLEHHTFAQATTDPGSGKPMVVTFPQNGTLKLTPAQETVDAVEDAESVGSYEFDCPTK